MNWTKFFRKLGVFLTFAICVWQWQVLILLVADAAINGVVKKGDFILKDWLDIMIDFKVDIDIDPKDVE